MEGWMLDGWTDECLGTGKDGARIDEEMEGWMFI